MPRCLLSILLFTLVVALPGCSKKTSYPQTSPDDTLHAAVSMIKAGDTRKLADLFYADSPEMRVTLSELGTLLENMQRLSAASAKQFPAEFKKLEDDALAAAEDPKNKTLVSQFMLGMTEFSNNPNAPKRQPSADDIRNAFSAVLADPFGWVDRNAARLTTVKTADDTAAVLFDGQPAIPIVGLPMRLDKGKWYIVLPVSMPPISGYMPRTRQQWSILRSTIKVVDNAMVDLACDVEEGRVRGLKNLTDKFQDEVLFPIAIAFAAYAKELDVHSRTDRAMTAFRARERTWVETRKKAAPSGSPGVSPKLLEAIGSLAPAKVEQTVRANKRLGADKLSDGEFEDLVGDWLSSEGLSIRFDAELTGDALDQRIAAWQADRKAKPVAVAKAPPKKKT